jgi:hypothetical protein
MEIDGEYGTYKGYVNQDGYLEGVGIRESDNGHKYTGEFRGGEQNGVIKAEYANGDVSWG